ncbi:MAG: conjugal transfer protein [Solirubrobacteraceae bacterium]
MSSKPHASVTVTTRPLWRIRLAGELPRILVQAAAVLGLLASARYAIAPPEPATGHSTLPGAALVDRAAEGFASLFVRRYLTWNSSDLEARRRSLGPYLNSSMEAGAGLQPPERGEQQVLWTEVVQSRLASAGERVYTIAAQTDSDGLLYLTVGVVREPGGGLALDGYPALVGAPASTGAAPPSDLREVEDAALVTVVKRAISNYLAGAESELDADLSAGARVSPPAAALTMQTLNGLAWAPSGHSVVAVVRARDRRGAQYTLAYELGVVLRAGRWEIAAIQMNPDS